ncbi:MAG: GNAT family N-acetyltransferase [Chloroflexi bacterium]|nr:GNAT family N-acetyltransferase [Chloroflexota bacterium]
MTNELSIREATLADIATLVNHRRWMFEEMAALRGAQADTSEMAEAYSRYLAQHLGGIIRAWVVEEGGKIIASGAVLFYDWPPRPKDLTGRGALLHSVYTAPEYRRLGLARRIAQTMVEACRDLGLRTITLHASDAGRPLYESLGFNPTSEMRLTFEDDTTRQNS